MWFLETNQLMLVGVMGSFIFGVSWSVGAGSYSHLLWIILVVLQHWENKVYMKYLLEISEKLLSLKNRSWYNFNSLNSFI